MTFRARSQLGIRGDEPVTLRRVSMGRVICPPHGRVDVVACFLCDLGRGLSDGSEERVRCAWRDESLPDDIDG